MTTQANTKKERRELNLQNRFTSIDTLIRSGKIKQARAELKENLKRSLPRHWRASFSNLARRCGLPMVSLRILSSIFSQDENLEPTSPEQLSYGASLAQIGAYREAREKLNAADHEEFPEALLHLALIEIMQWNYIAAESLLKRYLRSTRLSDYQRLIGQLNLASCYSALDKWILAEPLLHKIRSQAKQNEHRLIEANSLEILAQCLFFQKRFSQAQATLNEASRFIDDPTSPYSLYIKKWQILVNFFSCEINKQTALENFRDLREQSAAIGLWETVRDIDFYTIWINQDAELLTRLQIGTPYKSYQKKIKAFFDVNKSATAAFAQYSHQITPKVSSTNTTSAENKLKRTFNLTSGDEVENPLVTPLKCGSLCHLLFKALTLDFYRPIRLGELFSHLYPNEFFNPLSSPGRIQKVAQRLNFFFRQNQIPLRIELERQHFRLTSTRDYFVLISRSPQKKHADSRQHQAMMLTLRQSSLAQRTFTSRDICHLFKVSERTALRFINMSLTQNEIFSSGKGRARRYGLPSNLKQISFKSLVDMPKSA